MTLTYLPRRLPGMEDYRAALRAAFVDDLAEALAYVEALAESKGLEPVTLEMPREITLELMQSYTEAKAWPALSLVTYESRPREESQQGRSSWLRTTIDCRIFLSGPTNRMTSIIERYADAIWLVARNHDPLEGAVLAPDTLKASPELRPGTKTRRSGIVSFDVDRRI